MSLRGTAARCAIGGALIAALLPACGNPTQSVQNCVSAPDRVISAIQQRVKPNSDATLRNGRMVHLHGSATTFVSAELHVRSDDRHHKGDVATWATDDTTSGDGFVSVDVHAREESAWPHARFGVTKNGALESRACAALNAGKTKAQIDCEQRQNSGQGIQLPGGKDCSDL
jgi:hypothetical protein